ncbi:hypothetical protein Busp01_34810 [Trinickia caryophylli]|nr:hypothetical protein Busp01_34810 [Trinickia caryophylli]
MQKIANGRSGKRDPGRLAPAIAGARLTAIERLSGGYRATTDRAIGEHKKQDANGQNAVGNPLSRGRVRHDGHDCGHDCHCIGYAFPYNLLRDA